MSWPSVSFRSELPEIMRLELDALCALLVGLLSPEHNSDGTHGAITADSVTVTERAGADPDTTGFVRWVDIFENRATMRLRGSSVDQSYLDIITEPGTRVRLFNDGAGVTEVMSFGALENALSMGLLGPTVRMASGFEDWGWGVGRDSYDDFMAPVSFTGAETPFKIYRIAGSSIFQISPPDFGTYTHKLGDHTATKFEWDEIAGKEIYARTAYYERARSVALGEWAAYTTTWSSDGASQPSLGSAVLGARYTLIGKTCHFKIGLNMGGTTTYGVGNYLFTLPETAASVFASSALGSVWMVDSGTTIRIGTVVRANTTQILMVPDNTGGFVGASNPFVWADNDQLYIEGTYEIA